MHFDTNLGYVRGLSRPKITASSGGSAVRVNVLEQLFRSMDKAQQLVSESFSVLREFGLPTALGEEVTDHPDLDDSEAFVHIDTADSLPAPLAQLLPIVTAIEDALVFHGAQVLLDCRVTSISPGPSGPQSPRWVVTFETGGACRHLAADHVVIATGKVAMPWIKTVVNALNIKHQTSGTVDIGVRLETRRADMEWMTRTCHYPKLTFLSRREEAVRTFCVCSGGRLMQYEFAGSIVLDGQHCIADPTDRTNFGIITTVKLPQGVDSAEYALDISRLVNRLGNNGPLVQTVEDFLAGRPTRTLGNSPVRSSLMHPAVGDLHACLPAFLVEDIREMIARLNRLRPGAIQPYALLAAPVVERAFPSIDLSSNLESSCPGIYFAGDSTGKIIGIPYAMATGLCAGRAILADARTTAPS